MESRFFNFFQKISNKGFNFSLINFHSSFETSSLKCSFKQSIECLDILLIKKSSSWNVYPPLAFPYSVILIATSPVSLVALPFLTGLPLLSILSTVPTKGKLSTYATTGVPILNYPLSTLTPTNIGLLALNTFNTFN